MVCVFSGVVDELTWTSPIQLSARAQRGQYIFFGGRRCVHDVSNASCSYFGLADEVTAM